MIGQTRILVGWGERTRQSRVWLCARPTGHRRARPTGWHSAGTRLALGWHSAGTRLVLDWYSTDTRLVLGWTLDGHAAGTRRTLGWYSAGTRLVLDWYSTGTRLVLDGHSTDTRLARGWHAAGTRRTLGYATSAATLTQAISAGLKPACLDGKSNRLPVRLDTPTLTFPRARSFSVTACW
jgi:hypothetical protein